MTREEALSLVEKKVKQKNLIKHCLAVEAVMRKLAKEFGEDEKKWGLTGLLHDIDYGETMDKTEEHSMRGADYLEDMGMPGDMVQAVRVHNEAHGLPRKSMLDKALYAADPLTGLIVAGALIHPEKKLAPLNTEFLLNRFQEKSFARGANREQISSCIELGLTLDEFIALGLEAMQEIDKDLGL